ncbi:transcription factor IBH1-like 1 [Bidens hawaiensis]|uniref:transcription factor IBH1-like 1 n=1 Tax=Bidens hawaiensis TaxID=980011 RepID=UPI00404B53F3
MNLCQQNLNSKETIMHNSCQQLKKEFIKKWIHGLQICCSSNTKMNILERKKKIKLSADIALASAKNSTTSWSKAIISEAKNDEQNAVLVKNLSPESKFIRAHQKVSCHKRIASKKILKKSYGVYRKMKKMEPRRRGLSLASCIVKRSVKKRTRVLKRLVPGGEFMDELSVIKEALDYILSLKV